jgi:NADH-quinone oxidoreductase subunit N
VVLGERWLTRNGNGQFEYPVLILLAGLGMGMMCSSGDLITTYVGRRAPLPGALRHGRLPAGRREILRGGLKYFVLGALSSGLLLYGASLIYGFAGSVRFDQIAIAVGAEARVGCCSAWCSSSAAWPSRCPPAPFHMWTPGRLRGRATPMVAFFTTAPKMAALVVFARILYDAFPLAVEEWRQVLLIVSMLSMAVGAFAGLVQRNLKRLLAYSSISNMGYALLAMSAGTRTGSAGC